VDAAGLFFLFGFFFLFFFLAAMAGQVSYCHCTQTTHMTNLPPTSGAPASSSSSEFPSTGLLPLGTLSFSSETGARQDVLAQGLQGQCYRTEGKQANRTTFHLLEIHSGCFHSGAHVL